MLANRQGGVHNYSHLYTAFLRVHNDGKLPTDNTYDGQSAMTKTYTSSPSAESIMALTYSLHRQKLCQGLPKDTTEVF